MKIEFNCNDINIYQSLIATYEKTFISPYHSFDEAESFLKEINDHLENYVFLIKNNYLYLNSNDNLIPALSFSSDFYLFLKIAFIKKNPYSQNIVDLVKIISKTDVFDNSTLYSSNPYLDIYNQLVEYSDLLVANKINYSEFIHQNKNNLDFLFPNFDNEHSDVDNYADLIYLNEPIIHQLKEKLYLNLLVHFIEFPEQYQNVSYLFIDFVDFFSFNKTQSYSYSHLKNIFLRFNPTHLKIISSLKDHPLYNLFIETLFIEHSAPVKDLDTGITDYAYYFDFHSLNTIIQKKIVIDSLFDDKKEYKTIYDYFFSIFKNNQQNMDIQRFKNLMIVYEKNKLENKLSIKNTEDNIIKI